jgi:uncharacterized membrane protein YkoI
VKEFMRRKWVVPVAALVLSLSIGSAAFAATGTSAGTAPTTTTTTVTSTEPAAQEATTPTTDTTTAPTDARASNPWGNQRYDETLLTGSTLEQVKAVVQAEVGSDATIVRIETDADGHAAYEAHVVKADGTAATVYVDSSFKLVSVEDQAERGARGHHGHAPDAAAGSSSTSAEMTS